MVTRRQFLKVGLIGGAAVAGLGVYYAMRQASLPAGQGQPGAGERAIIAAIAPAVLAGMLPASGEARLAAIDKTVSGVGAAIAGLSAGAQEEIGELFALLNIAPARMLLAGIWSPWGQAAPDEVADFLQRWRASRFALQRSAYAALHDLVLGAWYGDAGSWAGIGYPGPPEVR